MLSVKWNNVICDDGVGGGDRDAKVIVCNVDAETARPAGPKALARGNGHRSIQERFGHMLIV